MDSFIKRVGTIYVPVENPAISSIWYQKTLGAVENYRDEDKAILDFANQSFFLVKSKIGEKAIFKDYKGAEHFLMTFEVDGIDELKQFHSFLTQKEVTVGNIEDRGHPGNNFVYYDLDGNKFDVWSELSPTFSK
ncbi:VOC family protein [Alkalicoccobacillus porphyridii]|uniref:VOC family protein n=1 Tax=Alkalicoccobacillus porphyridii TaxID=2597270 RepID=A0A553ZXH7_9BACI|nr:VOC family protein [Alkalicoccobacillus porphyridii]TSB46056.1 VOC family protein [Alkalicoccobacillus porphyridii]